MIILNIVYYIVMIYYNKCSKNFVTCGNDFNTCLVVTKFIIELLLFGYTYLPLSN